MLGVVTAFVFWDSAAPSVTLGGLAVLLGSAALRALHRARVVRKLPHPADRVRRLRVDVWASGAVWGFGGPLLVGSSDVDLALLFLIYAGLMAAATSTVVADRPSFLGFATLLLVPMVATLVYDGLSRDQVSLLLMTVLFTPFMAVIHARAHRLLTDQITTQSRLRISEAVTARRTEFLDALLQAAPNPILVLTREHTILRVNPSFEQIMGHGRDVVLGRPLSALVDHEEDLGVLDSFLTRVFAGERSVVEVRMLRLDGTSIWVRLTGTASSGAQIGGAILMGEDVTAQVATREALEAARVAAEQSVRAKTMFLASMSHEIRTPMNGVMGMLELLLDTDLDEQQMEWADVLRTSADDLLTILNDILDVSKIEAGQLRLELIDFDLPKQLGETARTFAPRAVQQGIELVLDVAPEVPHFVRGDPVRIRQILNNLLSNALKFTHEGEVTLAARGVRVGGVDAVRLSVRDTGIGIPEDKREQIFEEFSQADASTTRKYGGTGLGLAICRRLVGMMDGTLEVASEEGRGSVFTVVVPFPVAASPVEPAGRPTAPLRQRRVLVIDDNAASRRIVRGAVESEGGFLEEADGASSGIALIAERLGSERAFDVVVLDSLMPEVDGFAVAEAVGAMPEPGRPKVLMLTSAATGDEAERARSLGVSGLLEKPASRGRLIRAIGMVLAAERGRWKERRMVTARTLDHVASAGRILFADDSRVNHHVAVAMLEKHGYSVDVVENGRDAVERALANPYDVVLMDVEMPVMDGVLATQEIRRHRDAEELPIVALTAHALAEQEERCRGAGMNDFLSKPFKAAALYAVVDRWSGRAAKAAQAGASMAKEDDA
jgi:PAS domain S-box-containing protein